MALITTTTPNLVGGVTQQSDALRFGNQCTEQINANPSVTKGLEKRPPTEFVGILKDGGDAINPSPNDYKVHTHTINRDTGERYVVSVVQEVNSHGYTDGNARANIYVHDIEGNQKTVVWDTDITDGDGIEQWEKDCFFGYLSPLKHEVGAPYYQTAPEVVVPAGPDEPDLKFNTIGDVTLLLNTKVSPQESFWAWKGGPLNGLGAGRTSVVQIHKFVSNAEYKITITGSTGWVALVEYTTASNRLVSTDSSSITAITTSLHTTSADSENTYDDGPQGTQSVAAYLWNEELIRLTTGASILKENGYCLWYRENKLFIQPTATATGTIEVAVSGPTQDSVSAYVSGVRTFSELADIAVPNTDSNGDLLYDSSTDEDSYNYIGGQRVEIKSSPQSEDDDYWVEHIPEHKHGSPTGTSFTLLCGRTGLPVQTYTGRWKECAAPYTYRGIQKEYGMPLILISKADGTFLIKRADGGGGYAGYKWKERLAGDENTNPMPTFVNKVGSSRFAKQIQGMTFYNGRLVFITDENVVMSESGDIWNFFRTTVTSVLDADPIDVATTSSKISILRHAIGYEDRLLLMSDQTQFLAYGDPVLTPETIAISPITTFESSKECAPITQSGSVFFPFKRGSYSGVREWYSEVGNQLSFGDTDITAHIPAYIEGDITKLASATNESIVVALSDTQRDTVYVFNYFGQGGSRDQFAWSKYTLDTGAIIHDIEFIAETAYLMVERPAVGSVSHPTLHLEKINFQPNRVDTGSEYLTRLDRRVDQSQCTSITYVPSLNVTTMTIPYHAQAGSKMRVVSKSTGETLTAGYTGGGTSISIAGDWSSLSPDSTRRAFWVGEEYEMSYTFSKPLFKPASSTGNKSVAVQGRHQLRYGSLVFSDSGPFEIKVTHANGTEYTHPFTGKILGSDSATINTITLGTGEFRFPLFSESSSITITATATSPVSPHLESAEFEANYSTRSRRM